MLDVPGTEAMIAELERAWGALDMLVNNAGVSQNLPLALMEEEDWDRVMDVNVKGTFLTSRAALRGMIRRRRGVVLNIGSLVAVRMMEAPVHYCASKAAIKGLSEALAKEVARYGIRVLCLAPGPARGRRRPQPSRLSARGLPQALLARPPREVSAKSPASPPSSSPTPTATCRARRSSSTGALMAADAPVCVVFGGSGAVGREVCRALVARGARVGFTFLNHEAAGSRASARARRDRRAGASSARWTASTRKWAASTPSSTAPPSARPCRTTARRCITSWPTSTSAAWDAMIDVNAKSSFFAVRRLGALMRADGGNIVLLGSIDGVKPAPSPVHYAASKAALSGMAKAMAKELGPYNIRVNTIAPGVLDGGLSRVLPDDLRARVPETLRPEAARTARGSREPGGVAGHGEHAHHRADPHRGRGAVMPRSRGSRGRRISRIRGCWRSRTRVLRACMPSVHLRRGEPYDLLWACHLAVLLVAAGLLLQRPALNAVGLLWACFGLPIWLLYIVDRR